MTELAHDDVKRTVVEGKLLELAIKNPNKIVEGQQITIPTPDASAPDEFGPSGSPAGSP